MAKVLLSFSGNKLSEDAKWNIFTFYEGLMRALVRNGNDVYYMIANEFVQSYNSRSNEIHNTLSKEKLDEYVKNQNFDLIIAFNNALYDGYLQKSQIPYIVWGVDPISVYADKDKLKANKSRYIFAGNCEEDKQNIDKYFETNKAVILRMATDVRSKKLKTENNISFVGSLWNSHEKKLVQNGLNPEILSKIIKLLRKNTNLTPEEICKKLKIKEDVFKDTSVFWVLHGIATTDRIRVLSGLTDLGLKAYGLSEIWKNIADTNVDLACCYQPELIYDIVATENLYNKSKIGFNMSHVHARESGFSFRLLDIMASNACIVTDDKKIYKELFGKYVKLPTFKYGDANDARKVCEYLLTHEKERQKIVAGCHKAIDAEFRFEHRFKQITDLTGVKLISKKTGSMTQISAQDFIKAEAKQEIFNDNKMSGNTKKKKIKVLAVVHTLYTNTYDTLYYEAKRCKNIDFNFVVIPLKQGSFSISVQQIEEMMRKKGYPYILGYNEATNEYLDLKKLEPDVVFVQSPYDKQRVSSLYSTKYLATFAKVFHISYGSTMLSYDEGRYKGFLTGLLNDFTGIFSESVDLANYLDKYNPGKYIPVGYMKCDKYLNYKTKLPRDKKYDFVIAWKPRWVGEPQGSNLLKYLRFFMNLCKEKPNFQLIFIKHQLCEKNLIENKILPANKVKKLFDDLRNIANIKIVEDGDFLDWVFSADVFVGDYCSTIMEFALSGKPVIYTPVKDIVLSDYGEKILSNWYVAKSRESLKKYLFDLKDGNDPKSAERHKNLYLISSPEIKKNGSIAKNIIDYLLKNINTKEQKQKRSCFNKIKDILLKIKRTPKNTRVRKFRIIYERYFIGLLNGLTGSLSTLGTFVEKRFLQIEEKLNRPTFLNFRFTAYHEFLDEQAYIAKVSKGLPPKKPGDKIRVVFLFQEASYWPSLKNLYENLKKDPRFEVFVIAIPTLSVPSFVELELKEENIKFLHDNNIDYIDSRCVYSTLFDPYTLRPDYVFVQIHFNRQRPMEYKTNIMGLYTKVCLVPHAFLLSASDNKELIHQTNYFRVFVPNEYHANVLSDVFHHDENIEIVGYPRFDMYKNKIKDSNLWKISKKENPNIKRIIWSPHWWAYGYTPKLVENIFKTWEYFYNFVQNNSDIELIIKPHPNLFNGLVASGFLSEDKKQKMLDNMNNLPNASVYMGGDYIDLFKTADLMVNNSISFLAEWLPSKKPMIFQDTERKFELNEIAEKILDVYYHADNLEKLNDLIKDLLSKKNDKMLNKRLKLLKNLKLITKENVSDLIKKSLIKHVKD